MIEYKQSLAFMLIDMATKQGNDAAVQQVERYADNLTDEGKDKLIRAIGRAYFPTRFEGYSSADYTDQQARIVQLEAELAEERKRYSQVMNQEFNRNTI